MRATGIIRVSITGLAFMAAIILAVVLWRHYMYSPWTRDGRVQADVISIAPDVSGIVASVRVKDNSLVKKGDVLIIIDQERYKLALTQAQASLAAARAEAGRLDAEASRRAGVGVDVVSREGHEQASAAALVAKAHLRKAEADLDIARLDLARTEIRSPVDGYVTNLKVFAGDYATAGVPLMALIDSNSFWVCGYFEETKLPGIKVGDMVDIELAAGGAAFSGQVAGVAKGIGERDNPTGAELLVNSTPTYNWVRLAQRIPVRVIITGQTPDNLAMGMTCTVIVRAER